MENVKFCPNCRKKVDIETEVCECGYKFVQVEKEEVVEVTPVLPVNEPKWLANVGLLLCIFSFTPGLIFAIIGLSKLRDKSSRGKCIAAIIIFAAWMIIGFIIGFVFAEELADFYM